MEHMSQLLKSRMKQLNKVRVETNENTASYRQMANAMIEKLDNRRESQALDVQEHEQFISEQISAINAQTEELARRDQLINKLRYAVA